MASLTPQDLVFRAQRRAVVAGREGIAGLDSIFVEALEAPSGAEQRWRLQLRFVPPAGGGAPATPPEIGPANVRITRDGAVDPDVWVAAARRIEPRPDGSVAEVELVRHPPMAEYSDPPVYELELVGLEGRPLLDPFFTRAPFVFRAGESSEAVGRPVPPIEPPSPQVDLDYLAKDYESFRGLMFERMAVAAPQWTERNPADLGVAVIEALAYVADGLSYRQDAVATEAYLRTARRRVSVRRHVRLLDYVLHEGANARAWIDVRVREAADLPAGIRILGRSPLLPRQAHADDPPVVAAIEQGAPVFETLHPARLVPQANRIGIHTWAAGDFALPAGATAATLKGDQRGWLEPGRVLIFDLVRSPETGRRAEALASLRFAVRLTEVREERDPLFDRALTRVEWSEEDALPVPLPVAARLGGKTLKNLTVARGNAILADHGRTLAAEELPPVPSQGAYRPVLARRDLTFAEPLDGARLRDRPATRSLGSDPTRALPAVVVFADGARWVARPSLLESDRFSREFCVEVEEDGQATLRFGDGMLGAVPLPDGALAAVYRIGGGSGGNLGPGALAHLLWGAKTLAGGLEPAKEPPALRALPALPGGRPRRKPPPRVVVGVTNLLPAQGGVDREPTEKARNDAPQAFRRQRRCVVAADYEELARRVPEVLRAACRRSWTGNWETAFVHVQRAGGRPVSDGFRARVEAALAPALLAGRRLEILPPRWVPVAVRLRAGIGHDRFREQVRRHLEEAFAAAPGRFFDPDRFGFGEPVYRSAVVAAAMAVDGVERVEVVRFGRWGEAPGEGGTPAVLTVGPYEIARVGSDASAPQGGQVRFELEGGR